MTVREMIDTLQGIACKYGDETICMTEFDDFIDEVVSVGVDTHISWERPVVIIE